MSPITEKAAKELIDTLQQAIGKYRKHELQLAALDATLEKHLPGIHDEFAKQFKSLQEAQERTDSGMKVLQSLERLEALLKALD